MPSDARFCVRLDGRSLLVSASEPALIVVATDAEGAGVLEAADLIHNGVAARVAIFTEPPNIVNREFFGRLPFENAAIRSARQLKAPGFDATALILRYVPGNEDWVLFLATRATSSQFRSVVVVNTSHQARRSERELLMR